MAAAAGGPLQAFAQMQRGVKESSRRVEELMGEVEALAQSIDARITHTAKKLKAADAAIKESLTGKLKEVEEVALQTYAEHEKSIKELREMVSSQRSQEGLRSTAQQTQLEQAVESLSQTRIQLDEHEKSTCSQLSAMHSDLAELKRGFSKQGDAVETLRAYVTSVEEKLSAQLDEQAKMHANGAKEASARWEKRFGAQKQLLDGVLDWRVVCDSRLDEAMGEAGRATAQLQTHAQRVEALSAEMHDVKLRGDPAKSSDLEERCGALEEQMNVRSREIASLAASLGDLGAATSQLQNRLETGEIRSSKHSSLFGEYTRALQQLAVQLQEVKSECKTHKLHLATMEAQERAHSTALHALESKLRHVNSLAEEQGRYLSRVGNSLYNQRAVPAKFRTGAIVPDFVPPPASGHGSSGHWFLPPTEDAGAFNGWHDMAHSPRKERSSSPVHFSAAGGSPDTRR